MSPTNTEWAFGTLINSASLHYTNWLAWLNGQSPTTLVGKPAVLHLISDNIYVCLNFTLWVAQGTGGFAYQRPTPPLPHLSVVNMSNSQFSFSYTVGSSAAYLIVSSSNLRDWKSLVTNDISSGQELFTNSIDHADALFFEWAGCPIRNKTKTPFPTEPVRWRREIIRLPLWAPPLSCI